MGRNIGPKTNLVFVFSLVEAVVADRRNVATESSLLVYGCAVVWVVLTQRPKHVVVNLVLNAHLRVQVSVAHV